MKKYSYAKIYLRLLLIVAISVLLLGFGVASTYLVEMAGNIQSYRATKSDALVIDTVNLAEELDAASGIVRSFTRRAERFDFETKLSRQKIEIGERARFKGKQVDVLESYLGIAREGRTELKAELLKGFQAAIDQLKASAEASLNQVEPTTTASTLSTVPAVSKTSEAGARAQTYPHLYSQEALSETSSLRL